MQDSTKLSWLSIGNTHIRLEVVTFDVTTSN